MKLCGNIKSERATKGPGSNEFLNIEVLDSDQVAVIKMKVTPDKDGKLNIDFWGNPTKTKLERTIAKKCECVDPLCVKCLLVNYEDDGRKAHPIAKKVEFREMYKKRR